VAGFFGEVIERLRRSTVQVRVRRSGSGSGVIWSPDGRIVTNAHVVPGLESLGAGSLGDAEVEFWDGRRMPASIVKRDRRRDLAALEVEASPLAAATIGDSNALRVGELVIAVGNPLGFTGAASTGVVHGLNWNEAGLRNRAWVVSQLRLAPGNSGGPLANARGELVGINTMIAGGLAFAIPSYAVAEFLKAPLKQQSWLGLVVEPVTLEHSSRQLGFIVMNVIPGSPADRSSLLRNDILVGAGGTRFYSVQDLDDIRANHDGVLELQFRRGVSKNIRSVAIQMAPASVRAA